MSRAGDGPTSREWFRDWFGEEYLELYPHRDEREAARAVGLYLDVVADRPDAARPLTLDLACGAGRHLRELAGAGLDVVGLDLSRTLLGEARLASPGARLVRGDMRTLPFADGSFGAVTSFFTSFGYFASREDDRRVAREIRRVLAPDGRFLLDFFNARRVRRDLVPRDQRRIGDRRVTQTREIVDDMVVKEIRIEGPDEDESRRTFVERVRLYGPDELTTLLSGAGLVTERRFGNYAGEGFEDDAERLILFGGAA